MLYFHLKSCSRTLQQNKDPQALYVNLQGPMSRCNCAAGRQRTGCVPVVESGERFDVPLAQSALLRSHVLVHSVGWRAQLGQTGLQLQVLLRLHVCTIMHEQKRLFPLPVGVSCSPLEHESQSERRCRRPSHHSRLCTQEPVIGSVSPGAAVREPHLPTSWSSSLM